MAETGLKPSARPSEAAVRRTGGTTRNAAVQGSERLSPTNVNARPRFRVKPPGINESPAMAGPKTPMVWSAVPMGPEYSMMPAEVRTAFSHHAGQVMGKVVRRNLALVRALHNASAASRDSLLSTGCGQSQTLPLK